jgi:hypothetical protein
MARWGSGVGARRGKRATFIGGCLAGDVVVTAEIPPWYGNLGRHAYGGALPTDRRSVAHTGTVRRGRRRARPREDSEEPRGAAHGEGAPWLAGGLGRRGVGADAEVARHAGARDVVALRRSSRPQSV